MAKLGQIKVLFSDIGGVLLTNGWDEAARWRAADKFDLDRKEMDERHHLTFDTYESGKISLEVYLRRVVFYCERNFTIRQFKDFMFSQSQPLPEMINFVKELANLNNLRVAAISNEGRELTDYRIRQFSLNDFIQFFIVSCSVHFRKPDEDIFRIALDVAQVNPENAVYMDDRKMFVEVAENMGIRGVHHKDIETTKKIFAELELNVPGR